MVAGLDCLTGIVWCWGLGIKMNIWMRVCVIVYSTFCV